MSITPYSAEENIQILYKENFSPILNFLYGHHARFNLNNSINKSLKKLNLKISKKRSFMFFTFLHTAMMDERLLDSINNMGYYHNLFGEGFDVGKKKRGKTFKSYLFCMDEDCLIHIGFDHRGTTVEFKVNITEQKFNEWVDWTINTCYNFDKNEFMNYYNLCNK